ncbi:hypothetical protein RvY_17996 [Ramazzottius varieornatus]|uniref:Uncharacterized protein n=1 Tax=Ramazzottius varieornatus TaxID=947166 RepID=A0A1D1W458_RAMVA|nr:hypothetical protein RvY_17996 [Ramazzottius varieornatus]
MAAKGRQGWVCQRRTSDDCWACSAWPDLTELYPGSSFFVSTEVLEKLQQRCGPAGSDAQRSCNRYGWELILALLGPHRLLLIVSVERNFELGILRVIKSMSNINNLFFIVIQHSRQVFTLQDLTADSWEVERKKTRRLRYTCR